MSRHTTIFTADPQYRARQEMRNRMERIRDEAKTTADTVNVFGGNETEQAMWVALANLCTSYIDAINSANQVEREIKNQAAVSARRNAARNLAEFDREEQS